MKTELATVASQYADAVLELAIKDGGDALADKVLSELVAINKVTTDVPDLDLILGHPGIQSEKKRELLTSLFAKSINDLTMRLLELLLDKRRLNLLPEIERQFRQSLNNRKNIVGASLVCADKLSDSAIADIKARLTEHLGKKLELEVKVDNSLIGGVVLRLGDQVIDGSLKGKLQSIERALLSV
ncbi:MAG TPA: ATP synthase F1 subunit delta [Drouetiella sp.]|jgi:F-type H+-transporting ATPase subunit delta